MIPNIPNTWVYGGFLVFKGLLNMGAAVTSFFFIENGVNMSGYWFAIGCADIWLGVTAL